MLINIHNSQFLERIRFFSTITLSLSLLMLGTAFSQTSPSFGNAKSVAYDPSSFANIQPLLDMKVVKNRGFGGVVCRIDSHSQGVLFEGTSGTADHWAQVPMESQDTFEIASTSKTFTAVTVLLLMEKGLLNLDDPISTYLAAEITDDLLVIEGHNYGPELTIRQLLNHTCGLPDYWYDPPYVFGTVNAFLVAYYIHPNHFWEPEELIAYAKQLDPIALPGTTFHYNDTGYVLLGLIIENVTGKSLHEVYRELLFEPLGLDDTYLSYRETPTSPYFESHRYEWIRDMHGKTQQSADWAGGGLVSSTRDLHRFIDALFNGEIFADPNTLDEMQQWVATGDTDVWYGLGLFRLVLDDGLGELWGHDGYGNSWMYYWPEQQISFVGTLNQARNDWWDIVLLGIYDVMNGSSLTRNSSAGRCP